MKTTTSLSNLNQLLKVWLIAVMGFTFFVPGSAWAQKRITEEDRKNLLVGAKEGLLEYKQRTDNAPYDFEKMRPGIVILIKDFYEDRSLSPDEIDMFLNAYDQMAKQNSGLDDAGKEKAINAFLNDVIREINKKPRSYRTEGESCNNWSCSDGLVCAPVPQEQAGPARQKRRCERVQSSCKTNSDCCTGYCHEDFKSKKKICRPQMVCYRPVPLGESCNESPVCEEGSCLPYNQATSTVLACELKGSSCSSDTDCCSGLCESGSCQENFVCKDCVSQGRKADRGRSCCEGLMKDDSGRCVIDRPPFVENSKSKESRQSFWSGFVKEVASIIIPQAKAQDGEDEENVVQNVASDAARDAVKNVGQGKLWENDGVIRESKSDGQRRKDSMEIEGKKQAANKASLLGIDPRPRSDFETCDINFKNDFFHGLKEKKKDQDINPSTSYDYQLTLLGFEYVALGSGVDDLWSVEGHNLDGGSIHQSLKKIARQSRDARREIFEKVAEKEKEVKCLCYDKNGYENLDEEKQAFFEEECPDLYGAYVENKENAEKLGEENLELGDASGIKYKVMYSKWVNATKELESDIFVANTDAESGLRRVGQWMASNDWNETEVRNIDLFQFTVKNPSGRVAIGSAVTAGLLSAGVIAITGGFAAGATLSAWAAAGIISSSAATGGMGAWMISSLKGAWTSRAPIVQDEFVKGRENYKCGKKNRCADYTRILRQPYNDVCNKHISANACIKRFLTFEEDDQTRYLIDPWIPLDVEESLIVRDTPVYADMLEEGYLRAKNRFQQLKPGEDHEDDETLEFLGYALYGNKVNDNYLERTFINEIGAGMYAPDFGGQESNFELNDEIEMAVKSKAIQYALEEEFFVSEEEENLELFANYVWDYHFIFPRKTLDDAIAYPPPGLVDYVELVSLAASNASASNLEKQRSLGKVHNLVLDDLAQTREGFGELAAFESYLDSAGIDRDTIDSADDEGNRTSAQGVDYSFNPQSFPGKKGQSGAESADNGLVEGEFEGETKEFQEAVASHKRIRKEREEAMDDYVEKMGDTQRGKKMLKAQKEVTKAFFSPLSGNSSGSSGSGLEQRTRSDLARTSDEAKDDYERGSDVDFSGSGGSYQTDFGSSSSRSSRSGARGSRSSGERSNGISDENARRMKDAIAARDEVGKENFEKKDGQSLWEIVTNTYIRVYDKLLPKRESAARLEELE